MTDFEREKREAIDAGRKALYSLKSAESDLKSAKGWGIYDMIGGGFISSMIKHSKMDSAKEHMEAAKRDLRSFTKELRDVDMISNLNLKTDDFLSFADWFFDGFFVDWMVQDRINQALKQVQEAIRRVESILRELQSI